MDVRTSDDIVVMTEGELRRAIDVEARDRLGIPGDEFITRWIAHDVPHTAASWDIGILVRLLTDGTPSADG